MNKTKKYDIKYWETYNWGKVTQEPSSFAVFCKDRLIKGQTLLDVCSGNGRDSQFFSQFGMKVTGFDYKTVNLVDRKYKFSYKETFDNVYCRFVLHCLPEYLEDYVLVSCSHVLNPEGLLMIEVRSDRGEVPERLNNHYRRLINFKDLCNKIECLNFSIEYMIEGQGLSVYQDEDPVLIRIIARKRGDIPVRGTRRDEKMTYNPIHVQQSIYILFTVKQILEDNGIPFFLIFGTLLGAYREGFFIHHDTDIDIGILNKYKQKVQELIDNGYFALYGMKYIREWHGKDHIRALQYKQDYIDLWFFEKQRGMYYSGEYYTIDAFQIDSGFSRVKLYGTFFNTVHDIETHLNKHYPRGWKIPIEGYHAKF